MWPQLELDGVSIVLRGELNPAIFHPSWFAAQDLVRRQEAEAAEVQLVASQAAIFRIEWLQMQITPDRFQAGTVQEPYFELLRDLVVCTFQLLEHTPLRLLGINRDFHYRMESEEAWNVLGHRLAPKEDWKSVLNEPGMRSLTMEGQRPDNLDGYIRVKVEPSTQVHPGVYVNINDHYQLPPASGRPVGAHEIIDILSQQWEESMHRSQKIAEKIVSLGDFE